MLSTHHPNTLWICKNRNPVQLCYSEKHGVVLIASMEDYFSASLGCSKYIYDYFKHLDLPKDTPTKSVEENTIIKVDRTKPLEEMFTFSSFTAKPHYTKATTWKSNEQTGWERNKDRSQRAEMPTIGRQIALPASHTEPVSRTTQHITNNVPACNEEDWKKIDSSLSLPSIIDGGGNTMAECIYRDDKFICRASGTHIGCYMLGISNGVRIDNWCPDLEM